MEAAVLDSCFLINWSSFSEVNLLKNLFNKLLIPENVFAEIKSVKARALSARWLSERYLVITPITRTDENEIMEIISLMARYPSLPTLDPPELYAFVLAKKLSIPLLTDNKAPKRLVEVVEKYRSIRVYDSLDILVLAVPREKLKIVVEKFINETSFSFSRKRLEELGL